MAEDPTVLEMLQCLDRKVTAFDGRLDDALKEIQRLADSVAVLRGTTDGLGHDVDVLAKRYHDHEARLQQLEPNGKAE
jgi:hypothetical protein